MEEEMKWKAVVYYCSNYWGYDTPASGELYIERTFSLESEARAWAEETTGEYNADLWTVDKHSTRLAYVIEPA